MFQQQPFRWFQCNAKEDCDSFDLCSSGYIKYNEPDFGYVVEKYIVNDEDEPFSLFDRDYAGSMWISDIHTMFLFARYYSMSNRVISLLIHVSYY